MERGDFEGINGAREASGEEPWKNPRNMTGGTLKLLDSRLAAARPMKIVLYEVVDAERRFQRHVEGLEWLRAMGLPVNEYQLVASFEELRAAVDAWQTRRDALPYDADGLVIKIDSYPQRRLLGSTGTFPPRPGAHQFPAV